MHKSNKPRNITMQNTSVYVMDGYKQNISCLATGNPLSILRWERENDPTASLVTYEVQHYPVTKYDLSSELILALGYSDDGVGFKDAGNYICTGYNEAVDGGNDTDSKTISVFVEAPVQLQSSSSNQEVVEFTSTNMYCLFSGYPLPTKENIGWRINGQETNVGVGFEENENNTITTTLVIASVGCDYEGLAECFATNTLSNNITYFVNASIKLVLRSPEGVGDLAMENKDCDGSYLMATWNKPSSWQGNLTYLTKLLGDPVKYENTTETFIVYDDLTTDTDYRMNVTTLSVCGKIGNTNFINQRTGSIGEPSSPGNVRSNKYNESICEISWLEPVDSYDNITHYKVYFEYCNRDSNICETGSDLTPSTNFTYNMIDPNTLYSFNVTASTCAGEGEVGVEEVSNCFTDTSSPDESPPPVVTSEETVDGVPIVQTQFVAQFPHYSEDNGKISCYFVIMVRYHDTFNSTTGDSNFDISEVQESGSSVQDNVPYYTLASSVWLDSALIGGGNLTNCSPNDATTYHANNSQLLEGRFYDMYTMTTVKSLDGTDLYISTSNGTLLQTNAYIPEPTLVPPTKIPIGAIIGGFCAFLILILLIISLIVLWKRRGTESAKRSNSEKPKIKAAAPSSQMCENFENAVANHAYESSIEIKSPNKANRPDKPKKPVISAKPKIQINKNDGVPGTSATTPMHRPVASQNTRESAYETSILNNEVYANHTARVSQTFVKLKDLPKHCEKNGLYNNEGFSKEFAELTKTKAATTTAIIGGKPENVPKNRFKNIITYDHSRVILSSVDGVPNSDYINASYIHGYNEPGKFIATQGPKQSTTNDFWRMVYEQNCCTIVMVTRTFENGKVKCFEYWPKELLKPVDYGQIRVTLKEETLSLYYVIRIFNVKSVDVDNSLTREVTQFNFVSWPDHGVPAPTLILRMHSQVEKHRINKKGPIIVHCSAGVGRTGTYIALDMLMNQMKNKGGVDVYEAILNMREQRPNMVQTEGQYIFIYTILLDLYLYGITECKVYDIDKKIKQLSENLPPDGLLGYTVEFNKIHVNNEDMTTRAAMESENIRKNRSQDIVPYDTNRVYLDRGKPNPRYINASYIKGYRKKDAFIVTQMPFEETVKEFWDVVLDTKVGSLVTLNSFDEMDKEFRFWPNENDTITFGDINITNEFQEFRGSLCIRSFVIEKETDTKPRRVVQYHFASWESNKAPDDIGLILELITELFKHQQSCGDPPIIVQCIDGSGRSGAFCALVNLIESAQTESFIDVFQTVRELRGQRPGMVESAEQYRFCYEGVQRYIGMFDLYSNFQ